MKVVFEQAWQCHRRAHYFGRSMRRTAVLRYALVTSLACACIANAENAPLPRPPSCATSEHRQFDFWQGDWDVRDPGDKIVGRNRIVAIQGGCALQENWTGASGH